MNDETNQPAGEAEPEETPDLAEASEPVESVESPEPAEIVEPIESTEAVDSPEPAEIIEPIESAEDDSSEPAESTEPTEPLEAAEPVEQAEAVEPTENVEVAEAPASETPTRRRRERRPTERSEMEIAIEAILFVSSEPVPRGKLAELFDEEDRTEAEAAIDAVLERFGPEVGRGFMAEEVAGGVRLATRPEVVGWLRRFFEVAAGNKLSMAALETLAIVAYRQPITAPEIQELRNVNATGTLKTLLERRLVRIAGRKEVVGKPFLYGTTREFLVHFGLNSLADLPPLEEFEETFGSDANLVDRSLEAPEEGAEAATEGPTEPSAVHVADLSAGDESRERELLKQAEEIEARQEASESVEAGSTR